MTNPRLEVFTSIAMMLPIIAVAAVGWTRLGLLGAVLYPLGLVAAVALVALFVRWLDQGWR